MASMMCVLRFHCGRLLTFRLVTDAWDSVSNASAATASCLSPPCCPIISSSSAMPTSRRLESDTGRFWLSAARPGPGALNDCIMPGPCAWENRIAFRPLACKRRMQEANPFPHARTEAGAVSSPASDASCWTSSLMMCSTLRTMFPMASSLGFACCSLCPTARTSSISAAASVCFWLVTIRRMISAVRLHVGIEPSI